MKKYKHTTAYEEESRFFFGALAVFFVVFCLYMYSVSSAVAHVVMRKEVDAQISELSASVSQLESEYIELQHSVSSDIAGMKGFVVADTKIFIDADEGTLVLSRN